MKKSILTILAVACGGIVGSIQAAEPVTLSPAEQKAALFASGATLQVSPIYYYGGVRYYHRSFVGYRTQQVVYRDAYGYRHVTYRRVAVYRYW